MRDAREPRRPIRVVERDSRRHLGARGINMQIVGVEKRPRERGGERLTDRGLP